MLFRAIWSPAGLPSTSATPAVGLISPRSSLIVVVFPLPLGPSKPKISPFFTVRFSPASAVTDWFDQNPG